MTDLFAATMWAIVAAVFFGNAMYAYLISRHSGHPIPAAMMWMFLALAVGTGMIGFLRTGNDLLSIAAIKIIERTAFIIAAVNGWFVVQLASGQWNGSRTMHKVLQRWNHALDQLMGKRRSTGA